MTTAHRGRSWPSADVRAALLLSLLVAVLFHAVLFRGQGFWERDIQFDAFTSADSLVQSVAQGSWPVWDPAIAFGQPLLAYPNSQVLYPPTWLNLVLRPSLAFTALAVLHALLSAAGAFLLARRLGLSRGAGVLLAGLWVLSGPYLSVLNVYHFAGASWIPWLWWAGETAVRRVGVRGALALGLVGALQVLAGSPEMIAMGQCLVLVALVSALHRRDQAPRAVLGTAFGGTLVALGLSAAQWIPTLALALGSARRALVESERVVWSVHPLGLLQILLPVPLDRLDLVPATAARLLDGGPPFIASLYLGLAAVPLVIAGIRARPALGALLLGTVLVALGHFTPAYALLMHLAPPLRAFRYPSKVMVMAALVWAVLAAFGLDHGGARARRAALVAGGALALLAAAFAAGVPPLAARHLAELPADWPWLRARLWVPAITATVALFLQWRAPARWRETVVGLVLLDLLIAHVGLNRTTDRALLDFKPPYVELARPPDHRRLFAYEYLFLPDDRVGQLLGHVDRYRLQVPPGLTLEKAQILSLRLYPYPPSAARYGIEGSFDHDERGLYRPELARLTDAAYTLATGPALVRLLEAGAVGRVVALHGAGLESLPVVGTVNALLAEPVRVMAVPGAVPRTYAVGAAVAADDAQAIGLLASGAVDPRRAVILPSGASGDPAAPTPGTSRIAELRPDRVTLSAQLERDGYVVLADTYDPGWRVRVDGHPAELLRANVAFRAVRVPAGTHQIEMVYRPTAVLLGAAVSAASLLLTLIAWRVRG